MTAEAADLSIVIPVLDAGSMLLDCLRSINADDPRFETILIDNGSSDGMVDEARGLYPRVRVIRNVTNRGFATASNQGLAAATGRYVLFLNTDALLAGEDLSGLVDVADADEEAAIWQPLIVGAGGDVENAGESFTWTGFFIRSDAKPAVDSSISVFAATAACMLVRREAVASLGGFNDEFFAYIEDVDLCWRARLAGHEVRVVPSVVAHHRKSVTTRRIFAPHEIRYLTFRNRFRTILANASPSHLCVTVPLYVLVCVAVMLTLVASGRHRSALAVVRGLAWPLGNPRQVRAERRLSRARRTVPDRSVVRRDLRASFLSRTAWQMFVAHHDRWDDATA